MYDLLYFFFFFQAEDGIRDYKVTGVQTCALPIVRLGDPGAPQALSGFAQTYPADTAAPTALYVLGDWLAERGERAGAARWFAELIQRYPADLRSSIARFRLATDALRDSLRDSAVALFRSEVAANAPH